MGKVQWPLRTFALQYRLRLVTFEPKLQKAISISVCTAGGLTEVIWASTYRRRAAARCNCLILILIGIMKGALHLSKYYLNTASWTLFFIFGIIIIIIVYYYFNMINLNKIGYQTSDLWTENSYYLMHIAHLLNLTITITILRLFLKIYNWIIVIEHILKTNLNPFVHMYNRNEKPSVAVLQPSSLSWHQCSNSDINQPHTAKNIQLNKPLNPYWVS